MKPTWIHMIVGAVVLSAYVTLAGFVVCPRCGYENEDTRTTCHHCEGALPKVAVPARPRTEPRGDAPERVQSPTESVDESPATDGAVVSADVVEGEVEEAKNCIRKGDLDLARLFLRNASALDMLRSASTDDALSREVADLLQRCVTFGNRVKRRCEECGGTGKKTLDIHRLRGDREYRTSQSRCPHCEGRGFLLAVGRASESKFRMGRALNTYTGLQQGRKYVSIGMAWVPASMEEHLTLRQIVQLKRTTAAPCRNCMGVGRVDCDECKGAAFVDCPNRDCENGMVQIQEAGQLVRSSVTRTERCKTCNGKGKVPCEECLGRGSVVCEKCNGTGQRPICSKCGGQGIVACRRCKGSGEYRGAPCTSCGGGGYTLCSSCSGDGRKK